MLPTTLFQRLPTSTALLLLANVFALTDAHAFPRETKRIPHRTLNVEYWPLRSEPPLPTAAALSPAQVRELLKRQEENTICGFIGGDPAIPATCGAGSHCVVDQGLGAIGCCPNGQEGCTTGLFTGCVDLNSGPQTELNPYVFSCGGSDVCYKNTFAGGYSQFGCGTASDLATTVATSIDELTTELPFSQVSEDLTLLAVETLSEPTTLGTVTSGTTETESETEATSTKTTSTSDSTSTTPTTTTSSTKSSTSTTTDPTTSTTTTPTTTVPLATSAPETSSSDVDRTGAIVGGTISGVAVLIALMAIAFYLRRRKGNARTGPGNQNTQYISPMSKGKNFAPVAQSYENAEAGVPPQMSPAAGGAHQPRAGYGQPGTPSYGYGVGAAGGAVGSVPPPSVEGDRVPLTREFDDFHRGFNDALENIREEDERVEPPTETPLWQQNRRQSRNLMWM